MRILRDTPSINSEIKENPDPAIATLLTRHLQFGAEFNPADPADLLTVFVIEPRDTLTTIDAAMNGCFLTNHYSGRRVGDPAFVPCFETLQQHATVYEMLESDPALPFGPAPNPRLVLPVPKMRLTVYMSEGDKALGISEWLMGSLRRMGRVDESMLSKEQLAKARPLAGFAAFVQVSQTAGFIGHSYFVSDPAVSSDLVSLVRYGLEPGVPGRPLEELSRPFWKISPARAASK